MNMNYPYIRTILQTIIFILFSGMNTTFSQVKIEGLLYLDNSPVSVEIKDGTIISVKPIEKLSDEKHPLYIAPGLIDIQINGYMGIDFSDQNLNTDGVLKTVKALWTHGVTTFLPTLITADHEHLMKSFTTLAKALEDEEIAQSVPGIHLEGPYISPVQGFRGAHLEKYIRKPDWKEFQEFQKAANKHIKIVTLAPEIEGSVAFIQNCTREGVLVSLGHHNGNSSEIKAAADAGARLSTHLGNGCANLIDRHNNPLWPQLADDRLSASIIADGFHLNQDEIQCFYKMKGTDRILLVSDALDLAGLEPGEYTRGERTVLLTPNVVKFPAENVLAGAASPISVGIVNMMRFTKCSLADAIQMASTNQAKLLEMNNLGELKPGNRADIILFTIGEKDLKIEKTFVAGKLVYQAKP